MAIRLIENFDVHAVRIRLHEILEAGHSDDTPSIIFDTFIVTLIILNVFAFAMGTIASVHAAYGGPLEVFNVVSVLIFTIEYMARLWVCIELPPLRHLPHWRARFQFARRTMLLIDLAAIAPFYLSLLFALDLRVLRVLRLVRFLKLARYSPALQTLGRVVVNERNALFGAAIIMVFLLLFASTCIYFLERVAQPEYFGSVPQAAWWALATLTTVGYGDVVPITPFGKLFGGVVMVFGLAMFALPIGILATGFSQEIHRREFVVTWSMVAKVPLFANLNAASISKVMANLRAQSYPAGAIVVHMDERVKSMYFIAAGEVAIWIGTRRQLLQAGDFFGETGLLAKSDSKLTSARAVSNSDLMILDRHDFEHLVRENKEFATQIAQVLHARRQPKSKKQGT